MKTQPPKMISRRRCLEIVAASAASAISLCAASSALAATNSMKKLSWQGVLLGADASITLYSEKEAEARKAIENMLQEVSRLEAYFSLYKQHSLISRLNKNGAIENPPGEFVELIGKAIEIAETTNGRFDPTIQPLFMAYKNLANKNHSADWAAHPDVISAITRISYKKVEASSKRIAFTQKGMGLTLNGIAQGYITDKAITILKQAGFENNLVNFGEYRGIGNKPDAKGWNIRLGKTKAAPVWTLQNEALAASAHHGLILNRETGLHHLIDPKTGLNQPAWREIYVSANTAVDADAASTALFAATPADIEALIAALPIKRAYIIKKDGTLLREKPQT